jgi:hypothetical protein
MDMDMESKSQSFVVIDHLKAKQAVVRRRCLAGVGVGIILALASRYTLSSDLITRTD